MYLFLAYQIVTLQNSFSVLAVLCELENFITTYAEYQFEKFGVGGWAHRRTDKIVILLRNEIPKTNCVSAQYFSVYVYTGWFTYTVVPNFSGTCRLKLFRSETYKHMFPADCFPGIGFSIKVRGSFEKLNDFLSRKGYFHYTNGNTFLIVRRLNQ